MAQTHCLALCMWKGLITAASKAEDCPYSHSVPTTPARCAAGMSIPFLLGKKLVQHRVNRWAAAWKPLVAWMRSS